MKVYNYNDHYPHDNPNSIQFRKMITKIFHVRHFQATNEGMQIFILNILTFPLINGSLSHYKPGHKYEGIYIYHKYIYIYMFI